MPIATIDGNPCVLPFGHARDVYTVNGRCCDAVNDGYSCWPLRLYRGAFADRERQRIIGAVRGAPCQGRAGIDAAGGVSAGRRPVEHRAGPARHYRPGSRAGDDDADRAVAAAGCGVRPSGLRLRAMRRVAACRDRGLCDRSLYDADRADLRCRRGRALARIPGHVRALDDRLVRAGDRGHTVHRRASAAGPDLARAGRPAPQAGGRGVRLQPDRARRADRLRLSGAGDRCLSVAGPAAALLLGRLGLWHRAAPLHGRGCVGAPGAGMADARRGRGRGERADRLAAAGAGRASGGAVRHLGGAGRDTGAGARDPCAIEATG